MATDKTAEEVANILADFVNKANREELVRFTDYMVGNVHRTLQQQVIGLLMGLVQRYARLTENYYDLRNEATVQLCKKICQKFDKYDLSLPLI